MNRLKKHSSTIRLLHKAKPSVRRAIIANCDKQLVKCLCDIALNILSGNAPISKQHTKRLLPHKASLRKHVDRKISIRKKQNLLQTGGFLPAIISAALPVVSSLLGGNFLQMRKLVVLDEIAYQKLKSKNEYKRQKPEERVLSNLDAEMEQTLNSTLPPEKKLALYNQALQKSQLFQRKQPKQAKAKTTKPLTESVLLKNCKKSTRAKGILKAIRSNISSDWYNDGQFLADGQVIPSSDIAKLLKSAVRKPDPSLVGYQEFHSAQQIEKN